MCLDLLGLVCNNGNGNEEEDGVVSKRKKRERKKWLIELECGPYFFCVNQERKWKRQKIKWESLVLKIFLSWFKRKKKEKKKNFQNLLWNIVNKQDKKCKMH